MVLVRSKFNFTICLIFSCFNNNLESAIVHSLWLPKQRCRIKMVYNLEKFSSRWFRKYNVLHCSLFILSYWKI